MIEVVQIMFVKKSRLLLGYRQNTGHMDHHWGFPSGRVEKGESLLDAARREAREEVAVYAEDLTFLVKLQEPDVDVLHHVFVCRRWTGEMNNAEPHLCGELAWFEHDAFPDKCTPITAKVMEVFGASQRGQ